MANGLAMLSLRNLKTEFDMKTQIEKLDRLIREIEMNEYLNEETLPKIREAKGLLNTLHEQCNIANVSKSFAVGENVRVECCIHGHEFEKGQVVTIVEHDPSQTTSWLCRDGRNQWWLNEEEANVC